MVTGLSLKPSSCLLSRLALLGVVGIATLIPGCGFEPWPDREPLLIEDLPARALFIATPPQRFFHATDSLTLTISGMRTGYACTRILQVTINQDTVDSDSSHFLLRPLIQAEVPTTPSCAIETKRDTTVQTLWQGRRPATLYLVGSSKDTSESLKDFDDTVIVVAGKSHLDTLVHVKNESGITSKGFFTFQDTVAKQLAQLRVDSLPPYAALNFAWAERLGDTVKVEIGWSDVDSQTDRSVFKCDSTFHSDSLPVFFREKLR
jgi:hypothetical protein